MTTIAKVKAKKSRVPYEKGFVYIVKILDQDNNLTITQGFSGISSRGFLNSNVFYEGKTGTKEFLKDWEVLEILKENCENCKVSLINNLVQCHKCQAVFGELNPKDE